MDFWSRIIEVVAPSSREVLKEKRLSPRIRCDIDVAFYKSESEAFTGKVVDVGISGMKIESPRMMKKGDRIAIRVLKGQGLHTITKFEVDKVWTEVMWCQKKRKSSDFHLGVKYSDTEKNIRSSWVTFILSKFGFNVGSSFQKRKDIRASSKLPVKYEMLTGNMYDGVIYNIGLGGVLLTGARELPPGTELKIRIGPYKKLESLVCHGKVVRNKFSMKVKLWMTGISFKNFGEKELKLLGDYIITVLKDTERENLKEKEKKNL